jgi:spermidine synthase
MNDIQTSQATILPASHRFLPWLLILFVGSGCAALIYEIVWFQLLELLIGSSAVSLGVLLGTYMGGLCLGSLALPRLISPRRHPLRVYACLELGIGIMGIGLLLGIPIIDRIYLFAGGEGFAGILLRGLVCALCLLPPTTLMGGTLPAIARWLQTTPHGVSWLGFLYGGNIVGAVFGCLLAAFYLLRVHDVAVATYSAAAVNGTIALAAFGLAALTAHHPSEEDLGRRFAERTPGSWAVYVAIGLSGMCALGAEVIWTRLMSLILGGTVYTFAIILAVFLAGLAIGSHLGSVLARNAAQPRMLLGWCQMLLAAAITWTAIMVAKFLPFWPIDTSLSQSSWPNFQLDLARCLLAILPATILWGASFPLALSAAARRKQDPGRLVGKIYASNTIGAIAGSIGFSIFIIPWIGTQQSQRLLIGLSMVAGIILLAPLPLPFQTSRTSAESWKLGQKMKSIVSLAAATGVAFLLAMGITQVPWDLVAFGHHLQAKGIDIVPYFVGEGMNSSIAVTTESNTGNRNFHVSGKIVASSNPQDMRTQKMLGHIPAMLHPKPRSVLVVGCGAGVTAGTFVLYPEVERIVICEIEPLIPTTASVYFGQENHFVMDDPRVEVVIDDARHYILKTQEKFDIITSDPIHPWIKGSATLYSREYFELCKAHLNPGGLITQWVPLYESDPSSVKSEMATFFDVFPEGTIWSSDFMFMGYDVVLLGQVGALKIDVDRLQNRLDQSDYQMAAQDLQKSGLRTAVELLATYAGRRSDLRPWLEDAEITRDRNLRLQYLAGMALNVRGSQLIFNILMDHCQYPEDLFSASEPLRKALRKALGFEKQQKKE